MNNLIIKINQPSQQFAQGLVPLAGGLKIILGSLCVPGLFIRNTKISLG